MDVGIHTVRYACELAVATCSNNAVTNARAFWLSHVLLGFD